MVRVRNGAPAQRVFSNVESQDQVTNQVMRLSADGSDGRHSAGCPDTVALSLDLRQPDSVRRRQTRIRESHKLTL